MLGSSQCVLVKHNKGNRLLAEKRAQRRREGHATGQFENWEQNSGMLNAQSV